jgi:hypothetical protein
MNSFSNIEIVNFDEFNPIDESIDLEREIGINYMNDFINDKYESEYLDCQSDLNGNESASNISSSSEINNSNFFNKKYNSNDSLIFGNRSICSENFNYCNLNNSFHNIETIINNSFSYLRDVPKINFQNELNNSSTGNNSIASKCFPCDYKGCKKIYKSKENLNLHYKNIHLKVKPYTCSYCDSSFTHRNGKLHSNSILYFLISLNKKYFYKKKHNYLKGKTYHERRFHTNILPHKCNHEGKRI